MKKYQNMAAASAVTQCYPYRYSRPIELNITGRLPLAGNLKPLVPSLFTHDQTKTFNLRENPMSTCLSLKYFGITTCF